MNVPHGVQVALDAAKEDDATIVEHDGGVCVAGELRDVTRVLLVAARFNALPGATWRCDGVLPDVASALARRVGDSTGRTMDALRNVNTLIGTLADRPSAYLVAEGTLYHATDAADTFITRRLACGCRTWSLVG